MSISALKTNAKMTVDRTYVKRKRIKKKLAPDIGYKRNDITWALWIENDGMEKIGKDGKRWRVKTRPLVEKDLKRSSRDFEEKHEVISAFLVVVNKDSTKKGVSVIRVENENDYIKQNHHTHLNKSHNSSYLQNKYLHRYSMYNPLDILDAVYRSIERLMIRPDYQKYWDTVNHQKRCVEKFVRLKKGKSRNSVSTAIEYLTIGSFQNVQDENKKIKIEPFCKNHKETSENR